MKYKLLKTWQLSLQPIIPITYLVLLSQQIYSRILRGKQNMARCTAPVRGHSSAAAAAACPACRNRSGYRRSSYSYDSYPSYSSPGSAGGSRGSSSGGSSSGTKPRWSKSGSSVSYTTAQVQSLTLKWFTEFGHLNRGDMLTSEQHRCHNEKKKFQRRV